MAFASAALWAWAARQKPVLAGAMIGLGTAAKLYPVFLLVRDRDPWRSAPARYARRRLGDRVRGAAGVGHGRERPHRARVSPHGWWEFYRFSTRPVGGTLHDLGDRQARCSNGSLYRLGRRTVLPCRQAAAVAVALIVALAVVVCARSGFAPVRPRLAQLAFLCRARVPADHEGLEPAVLALAGAADRVGATAVAADPGVAVQSRSLVWILTLDGAARLSPRPRTASPTAGLVHRPARCATGCCWPSPALVIREMWCPWLDVVRADGADDPGGGVFDGAPDRWPAPRPDDAVLVDVWAGGEPGHVGDVDDAGDPDDQRDDGQTDERR